MAASLLIARRASAHASALSRRASLNLLSSNGGTACPWQCSSTAAAASHAMFASLSAASSGSATHARRTKDAAAATAAASTSTATGGSPKKSKVAAFKLASATVSTPASAASSAAAAASEASDAADDSGTAASAESSATNAVSFASLGLGSHIVKRAARLRFEAPTLIQQMVGRYLLYLIQLALFQFGVPVIDLFQMYS
jgi:hypothetical protein